MRDLLWTNRYLIVYAVLGLGIRLIYALVDDTETFDWVVYRVPIAERLSQGEMLYRDVPYNHMPIYPYYTAIAHSLFGESYLAYMLPAILGDALIAPLLFLLTKNHWIATLYLVSAVSIEECSNAHWDGLTTLFLLLAISYEGELRFSLLTAVGVCLKEFPVVALVRALLGWKELRRLALTVLFSVAILGVFLVYCPWEFVEGITSHSVYRGVGSENAKLGSMAWFVPTWAWAAVFIAMLVVTLVSLRAGNHRNTVGILVFMATFMMYVTHKHTEIAFIPFALLLVQRSRYWVLVYLFCQYFILLRMAHSELANHLFPLTFVIWGALVWENVRIAREGGEGPGDIIRPLDTPPEVHLNEGPVPA